MRYTVPSCSESKGFFISLTSSRGSRLPFSCSTRNQPNMLINHSLQPLLRELTQMIGQGGLLPPRFYADIIPFGSRIKHVFHHTIRLNISFPQKAHFRYCSCSFVMKTDKCMYGKLILFAFYQPTEITTCSNNK